MNEEYRHTQTGYLVLVAVGGGALCAAAVMALTGFHWLPLSVALLLWVCLVLFSSLTVTVDAEKIVARFGPGVIRKTFLLSDVESCEAVRNQWYWGWGIRWIVHGWLYNVSGLSAVELRMKSGRRNRIGTDEPGELQKAIQRFIGEETDAGT